MAVDDYTEYVEVRTVLGVTAAELPDANFEGETIWFTLKHDFLDIDADILTDFAVAEALPTPTTAQLTFVEMVRIFATYSTANILLDSLPLFSPKAITEGKTNLTRYSDSPYRETSEKVRSSYLKYRKKLEQAYEVYDTGGSTVATVLPLMGVSSPTYDPITDT